MVLGQTIGEKKTGFKFSDLFTPPHPFFGADMIGDICPRNLDDDPAHIFASY